MRRTTRLLLAAVLLSGGCYHVVPNPSVVTRSDAVGEREGQLRIGTATKDDVIRVFGEPADFFTTPDGRFMGYLNHEQIGVARGLHLGPCSQLRWGDLPYSRYDDVWFEFDQRDVLRRYEKHLVARSDRECYAWDYFRGARSSMKEQP